MRHARLLLSLLALAGLWAGSLPAALGAQGAVSPAALSTDNVVVRLYFGTRDNLNAIAGKYDVWEVHHNLGYAVVMLSPEEYRTLLSEGYRMEIDQEKTWEVRNPLSIPGYPCYRTVEETYTTLQNLATTYPSLAELFDIGDSWAKIYDPPGYDLYALRITNEDIPGPKPTFFLMAEIHAREYTTAETATRFAEYLLQNYGTDPTITFFLDYNRIYVVPMTNPDGRKIAEGGVLWRKNVDSDDGCLNPDLWGTDLNRNHSFKWGCCNGSSGQPCAEIYRGPSAGSEPEVQSIQNLVLTLFPDQRGPGDTDPAPADATGIFITLHSYQEVVLWPWGWTYGSAPNSAQLQTVGTKLATYNGYWPEQSSDLYITDGTSDDWSYGELGVASFTFEMGTSFFQGCTTFENVIWPDNRDALLYAWKVAQTPYMTAYGPDALNAAVTPNPVPQGNPVQLTATINDTQNGNQQIQAAEYYVLPLHGTTPPGDPGSGTPMSPADGSWNSSVENVVATADTCSLLPNGDYIIAVRGMDAGNNWGPFTAVFVHVGAPAACEPVQIDEVITDATGCSVDFSAVLMGSASFSYAWDFGPFGTSSAPTPTVDFSESGTYAYTLTVTSCCTSTDTVSGTVSVTCCTAAYDAAFTYAPPAPLIGEDVTFTGTASGTAPISYTWDFGDDTTGSGAQVTHAYAADGDYIVVMTASNACGQTAVSHILTIINGCPPGGADFTWSPITPTAGATVTFTGSLITGTAPFTWTWEFSNGGSGSGQSVTHVFANPGTYAVTMTVVNECGQDGAVHTVVVVPACDPVDNAAFTWYPPTPLVGEDVTFNGTATGTLPIDFAWDFGDDTTGSGAQVTHAFAAPGLYPVTLTATNGCGQQVVLHTLTVVTSCVAPDGADFTWSPIIPTAGATVDFFGSLVTGTAPLTWTWEFGDGDSGSGQNTSHVFAGPGTYAVTMTVVNECGQDDTVHTVVVVACDPVHDAAFSWDPTIPYTGDVVTFTGTAAGDAPIAYAWYFGDGATAAGATVYHTYATTGTYTVIMTVTNCQTGTATVTHQVIVIAPGSCVPAHNADFIFVPGAPYAHDAITFTASVAGDGPFTYTWSFGDGQTGTGMEVPHAYALPGTYTAVLTVTNCAGAYMDTASHTVTVLAYQIYLPLVYRNR